MKHDMNVNCDWDLISNVRDECGHANYRQPIGISRYGWVGTSLLILVLRRPPQFRDFGILSDGKATLDRGNHPRSRPDFCTFSLRSTRTFASLRLTRFTPLGQLLPPERIGGYQGRQTLFESRFPIAKEVCTWFA